MKKNVLQLFFIIILFLLITSCSNKNNDILSSSDQKTLTKLVYNKVTNNEAITGSRTCKHESL